MRLDPKLVHPSIFKATDGVLWSGQLGATGGPHTKSIAEHQQIWFKEHGLGCAIYALASALTLAFAVSIAHDLAKPLKLLVVLGAAFSIVAVGLLAYWRNTRQITGPELNALLPMLELSEVQRAYSETLVALERSGRSRMEIEETLRALNALLDEDLKLSSARQAITGNRGSNDPETLQTERQKLSTRLATARDPEAKAAFEASLALLDERIEGHESLVSSLERIDAQQELLRQAVLATRDAALHQGAAPAFPELGADSLRAAVARAREQTQETERALSELRSL